MRKNRVLKIFLTILIILIACFLTTKVNAANVTISENSTGQAMQDALNRGDNLLLSYTSSVAGNKYIFCRDQSNVFPRSGTYTYEKDSGASTITFPNTQNQGAAWGYLFGKNINLGTGSQIASSSLQQAFWRGINGQLTGYTATTISNPNPSDSVGQLISEANSYGNQIANGYKINSEQIYRGMDIPNNAHCTDAAYPKTYGPFKVDCDFWVYNNKLMAGITQVRVVIKNSQGTEIQSMHEFVFGNYKDKSSFDNDGIWIGAGKALSDSVSQEKIIKFNQNMKNGFYLHFLEDEDVASISIEVRYKYIKAGVTFTPIKSISQITTVYTDWFRCYEHEDTNFDNMYYFGDGYRYTYVGSDTQLYKSTQSSYTYGQYRYEYKYISQQYYCSACGYIVSKKDKRVGLYNYEKVCSHCGENEKYLSPRYKYTKETYKRFYCNNSNKCGTKVTFSNSNDLQKLVVANPTYSVVEKNSQEQINLTQKVFTFKLQKYNLYERKENSKTKLSGAKFRVTERQDGTIVYQKDIDTDQIIELYADLRFKSNVYVTIEEINAPKGYIELSKPINLVLTYHANTNSISYYPTFKPNSTEWSQSSFNYDDTFGNWSYLESEAQDLGNGNYVHPFRSSKGDYFDDELVSGVHVLKLYNAPKAIKYTIKKWNSYYNKYSDTILSQYINDHNYSYYIKETPAEINCAKFTVIAKQKKGNSYENLTINGNTSGKIEHVTANTVITISPKYAFYYSDDAKKNDIYIMIQEETTDETKYSKMSHPIFIKRSLDSNYKWQTNFCIPSQYVQNVRTAFNYSGNDIIWSWVHTAEDLYIEKIGDNQVTKYNNALPNYYCYSGTADEVSEDFLNNNPINSIMYVEPDNSGNYIINIYNEFGPLEIKLEKYGNELIIDSNNENAFEKLSDASFKITAKQNNIKIAEETVESGLKINPQSLDPIEITIEETKAPVGYKPIKSKIKIYAEYRLGQWMTTFDKEIDNVKWTKLNNETSQSIQVLLDHQSSHYKSPNDDLITVTKNGVIKVYDNHAESFQSIKLFKVNKANHPIPGAKFNISISNIYSFKIDGVVMKPTNGNTYSLPNWSIPKDGLFVQDVVVADPSQDVIITLQESQTPGNQGEYLQINGTMTIKLSYSTKTAITEFSGEGDNPVSVSMDEEETPHVEIRVLNKRSNTGNTISIEKINDFTEELLTDAHFSGTINNILSFKDEDGATHTSPDGKTFTFTDWVLPVDLYNIQLADNSKPLNIELKEEQAPEDFVKISDTISINANYSTQTISIGPSSIQDKVNASFATNDSGNLDLKVQIKNRRIPKTPIDIGLEKFGEFNEGTTPLTGAEFEISVYQDGYCLINREPIISNTVTENNEQHEYFIYTIQPETINNVYVIIYETKAPEGYKEIAKPITISYYYNNNSWEANYSVSKQELSDLGLEECYGNWIGNNIPYDIDWGYGIDQSGFTYCSSENDNIVVTEDEFIYVFDEICQEYETLKILKINETGKKLSEATFTGSISNIESFEYKNIVFKPQGGDTFTFTDWELPNGELVLNRIRPKNPNLPVVVTLQESQTPGNPGEYLQINGTMTIELYYGTKKTIVRFNGEGENPVTATMDNEFNPNAEIRILNKKAKQNWEISITKFDLETQEPKDGAKFNGTISNVLSFIDEKGETYTATNGVVNFNDWELPKNLNSVELKNPNESIEINLEEELPPKGYEAINGGITISASKDGGNPTVTYDNPNYALDGGIVKTEFRKTEDADLFLGIAIGNTKSTIKPFTINLKKCSNIEQENYKELQGAEFTISLFQDGKFIQENDTVTKVIGEDGVTERFQYEVYPITNHTIYAFITETTAPEGYEKIECPIIAKYTYISSNLGWNQSFNVTKAELTNLGLKGIDYEWTGQGNSRYKSTKGDLISVDANNVITVYDKKIEKINQLSLIKTDENDQPIGGSKFYVTISNISSLEYRGIELKPQSEGGFMFDDLELYQGSYTVENAILSPQMIDNTESRILITLQEREAPHEPQEYKPINGMITIELYRDADKNWHIQLSDECREKYQDLVSLSVDDNYNPNVTIRVKNLPEEPEPEEPEVFDINGIVWEDSIIKGEKINGDVNGKKDPREDLLQNIIVYLYKASNPNEPFKTTVTNSAGWYGFSNLEVDPEGYYVEFGYDGVNYQDTIKVEATSVGDIVSNAEEYGREDFNKKFTTINKQGAIGENGNIIPLEYSFDESTNSSIVKTKANRQINENVYYVVKNDFEIRARTNTFTNASATLNFGVRVREMDLALTNSIPSMEVIINDKSAQYNYNPDDCQVIIGEENEDPQVGTYLYDINESDYNYRIRDYINNNGLKASEFTDNVDSGTNPGFKSGEELSIYVKHQVNIVNQSASPITLTNVKIKFYYDDKYNFINFGNVNTLTWVNTNNTTQEVIAGIDNIKLAGGSSYPIYAFFELSKKNDENVIVDGAEYTNSVEIVSYSTEQGLIDKDSAPDNINKHFEDDTCQITGKVRVNSTNKRIISGYVWEDENKDGTYVVEDEKVKNPINGVIVQLIEVKKFVSPNNEARNYEYIWQETVSGSGKCSRIMLDASGIEYPTYEQKDGYYEFTDFIPGEYIIRFIYGDGSVVDTDLNGNVLNIYDKVLKYNGQDYQSTVDVGFNKEYYPEEGYGSTNVSVARDNEARRLETMSYAVDVDQQKGLLLKLYDVKDATDLNATEIKTLVKYYTDNYDSSFSITEEEYVNLKTDQQVKDLIEKLEPVIEKLQAEVLANTWMCAETSKIVVPAQEPNPKVQNAIVFEHRNINFGLKQRPTQQIELKKYITGFTVTASNRQKLVDATIDLNTSNPNNISQTINGIKNGLTIYKEQDNDGGRIQYEAGTPTELNTILEGAKLEFKYTVIVKNVSEDNYLSETLTSEYNNGTSNYEELLVDFAGKVKNKLHAADEEHYVPGSAYLGYYYYTGVKPEGTEETEEKTRLAITEIKDYLNNDFELTALSGNVTPVEDANENHYVLNDIYELNNKTVESLLRYSSTDPTNKLTNQDPYKQLYSVNAKPKFLISASGTKEFDNYIAEVMEYTNASGRRADIIPGNAEIIDHEYRPGWSHETDEADTLRIQIGVATGQDKHTPYIIAIIGLLGVSIIALGIVLTKKYIRKG